MIDPDSNRHAYDFWARKTRARIQDRDIADVLAPLEPPHPFGAKRPSLEQDYYDQFNRPNVHVVSVKKTPIIEIVPEGILTSDGKIHELDVIALATGFDAVTGGLKDIKITGLDSQVLSEKWKYGTWTYLGMTTSGFPNFFFTYGPQAPTAFSNGPACLEPQCDFIVHLLSEMREKGLKRIDAKKEKEEEWRKLVNTQSERTLRHNTESW
jgi:cation diffusion facilitator CzcD-associated flavoprotein CzcO